MSHHQDIEQIGSGQYMGPLVSRTEEGTITSTLLRLSASFNVEYILHYTVHHCHPRVYQPSDVIGVCCFSCMNEQLKCMEMLLRNSLYSLEHCIAPSI